MGETEIDTVENGERLCTGDVWSDRRKKKNALYSATGQSI
jgi:hypothetical protein